MEAPFGHRQTQGRRLPRVGAHSIDAEHFIVPYSTTYPRKAAVQSALPCEREGAALRTLRLIPRQRNSPVLMDRRSSQCCDV
jgi:hypothetical protein